MTSSEIPDEHDRPRGILTKADRAYLTGERTYKHRESELNRRKAIRGRLRESIRDISIILENLQDEDVKKAISKFKLDVDEVLQVEGEGSTPITTRILFPEDEGWALYPDVEQGLFDILLLVYRIMHVIQSRYMRDEGPYFGGVLEEAHEEAISKFHPGTIIEEVTHEIKILDLETATFSAQQKMEEGEPLRGWEIHGLLQSGEVSDEKIGQYVRQYYNPD